jgi:hypothetical protein
MDFMLDVVYFINTYMRPRSYEYLLRSQLKDLLSTGLMKENVRLWIECCGNDSTFGTKVADIMGPDMEKVTISMHNENNHEYFGIDRVWRVNQNYEGDDEYHLTLYFHSKGISHKEFTAEDCKHKEGVLLFNSVIRPWRDVIKIFREKKEIDKVGYSFNELGWIWYNFWWVRGSYCKRLERPIKTTRRHYYEDYLCRIPHQWNDPVFKECDRPEIIYSYEIYNLRCDNCYGMGKPVAWSPR